VSNGNLKKSPWCVTTSVEAGSSRVPVDLKSPQQFVAWPVTRSNETPSSLKDKAATPTASDLTAVCQNTLWPLAFPGIPVTVRVLCSVASVSTLTPSAEACSADMCSPVEIDTDFWSNGTLARLLYSTGLARTPTINTRAPTKMQIKPTTRRIPAPYVKQSGRTLPASSG